MQLGNLVLGSGHTVARLIRAVNNYSDEKLHYYEAEYPASCQILALGGHAWIPRGRNYTACRLQWGVKLALA